MTRRKILIVVAVIALTATGAFAASTIPSRFQSESEGVTEDVQAAASDPGNGRGTKELLGSGANVKVAEIVTGRLVEQVVAHGVTAPILDVTYAAEVPGRIEHLSAQLGNQVKKGQVLARIDYQTQKAQAVQAEANFGLAKTTHTRMMELGENLVSRQKLDEASSALTGAEAQLEIAKTNISKSVVRSSIKGVVTAKYVEQAEYVGPGTPMFRIVDYSTIIVEAQLPETQVALLSAGEKATVNIDALGKQFDGVVDAILPTADPVSKTFTVRVKVSNKDLRILVGMSANLNIVARVHEDAIAVPQDVVIQSSGEPSVFVAINGIAKLRPVRLGPIEGVRVAVLEGLEPGEKVIVLGHRSLTDGQPIHIVK